MIGSLECLVEDNWLANLETYVAGNQAVVYKVNSRSFHYISLTVPSQKDYHSLRKFLKMAKFKQQHKHDRDIRVKKLREAKKRAEERGSEVISPVPKVTLVEAAKRRRSASGKLNFYVF